MKLGTVTALPSVRLAPPFTSRPSAPAPLVVTWLGSIIVNVDPAPLTLMPAALVPEVTMSTAPSASAPPLETRGPDAESPWVVIAASSRLIWPPWALTP